MKFWFWLALLFLVPPAAAAAGLPGKDAVIVHPDEAGLAGDADAASQGTIDDEQLENRPLLRPAEVLEVIPGLVVTQHSGTGKANQYFLRGFNLDHGTDLRTTVDEMPVNQRSHAHGQGWTDLNFLIPELSARLDYKKGPYSASEGDFASAGATAITYANRLTQGIASATAGQNGFARALLADSPELGKGNLLYAVEAMHNDGPFTHGDNYRKLNAVLRYSEGYANNGFSVAAMAYRGNWNSTDQIPQRAVDKGTLGRFDAIDTTDGGEARRFSLSGIWRRTTQESALKISAYVIANRLKLFSNFTYVLDDAKNGDQFAQPDRRVTSGLNASHSWHWHEGELASVTTAGVQVQNDNIFNGLYKTRARQVLSTTREDHIVETSTSAYVENATRWTPVFRTNAGLRADHYRFDVARIGRKDDTLLSPSISIVLGPWAQTEFYINAGNGFHSNDARGVLDADNPATPLARSRGQELGVRSEWVPGLQSSLSLYKLDFDSELVFIGDAGNTEASRPSRRYGVEFSNYWKPLKWLSVDADLAFARGRYRDEDPAGDRIPGAVEGVGQLAFTVAPSGPWSGSLRMRYFGPRPLVEDNSVRSRGTRTVNGRIGYRISKRTHIELEGFNLGNRHDSAIEYYYASRLSGEAAPVDDIHFHPIESRTFRLTLTTTF